MEVCETFGKALQFWVVTKRQLPTYVFWGRVGEMNSMVYTVISLLDLRLGSLPGLSFCGGLESLMYFVPRQI